MDEDSMPPRPICEFDFNLPHGIDNDHGAPHDVDEEEKPINDRDNDKDIVSSIENEGRSTNSGSPSIATMSTVTSISSKNDTTATNIEAKLPSKEYVNHAKHDQAQQGEEGITDQEMNYENFPSGFSDDEGGEEAFDRSWEAHQARKLSPKNKKSPRRSETEESENESYPKSKRLRQSLFGGPTEGTGIDVEEQEVVDRPKTPEMSNPGIQQRMSSLSLAEHEIEDSTLDSAYDNTGFDRDSVSSRSSPSPSEDSIEIPPDIAWEPAYDLRQNIDRNMAMTYVDDDKTGDFDPNEEARKKSQEVKMKFIRLQKAKAAKASKKDRKGKSKSTGKERGIEKRKIKKIKEHAGKWIIKLSFGNVRNATNDEDNWSDGHSELDSEEEREVRRHRNFYRRNTPGYKPQQPIEDPLNDVDDLTGHPAARACRRCRGIDAKCSMVLDGIYPCKDCEDEGLCCDPILETSFKGSCKQCSSDEQVCSFQDNPDQMTCDYCIDNDFDCEALPPNGYKAPRISIDEIMYGPDRKHAQCTFCRSRKKKCSLKKTTDKPPCKYCKKNGIGCTFYDLPKTTSGRKASAKGKGKVVVDSSDEIAPGVSQPGLDLFSPEDIADLENSDNESIPRASTPIEEMEDEAGNKGLLTKIMTAFAHPMQFNVEVQEFSDCNFCELPFFGLVGHFEREVYVIEWYSGLGYTDVGGGHCENNGPTMMCSDCTLNRIQIICCEGHTFHSLCNEAATQDFDLAFVDLVDAEPGSINLKSQLLRWCSMCCSIATWACATGQPSFQNANEEIQGCGLRLCDKCVELLRDGFNWDLGMLANEMDMEPKVTEEDEQGGDIQGRVRADVGFLHTCGLLMRCVDPTGVSHETGLEADSWTMDRAMGAADDGL